MVYVCVCMCVCVRARAHSPPCSLCRCCCCRRRCLLFLWWAGEMAAGMGWGRCRSIGMDGSTASQGQESLEIFETQILGPCRTDGLEHLPMCPSPLS